MRSIVFEQFGEPTEVLQLRDVPVPKPGRNELRVRMLASPVNPSDLMTIRGIYGQRPTLPATPGYEGVGIVESSGGGLLGNYLVGRRVAVLGGEAGNWREQTIVPARRAIPLASDLPVDQCAMFFVNPATAYVMTRQVLGVEEGAWLLQTAAGSALGRMVIRLGKKYGFRTLNVVRRKDQVDELKKLGGDEVLAFDPHADDPARFRDAVRDVTSGQGVPYLIDPVGGSTGSTALTCLGRGGRMLVFGTLSNAPLSFSSRELMTPGARIEGFWLSNWMASQGLMARLKLVRTLTTLIREGTLHSEVGTKHSLEQFAQAVAEAEQPGRGGKVLLQIASE